MTPAIVIGCYRLSDFIRLNLTLCQSIFPDSPILLSDDRSPESSQIEDLAEEFGVAYMCSKNRRTHVSGDWQCFINGSLFGQQHKRPVLKLSQRFIPTQPEFWTRLQADFHEVTAVLPGKLERNMIARPEARFYLTFGHLTDVLLYDPQVYTPDLLQEVYQIGFHTGRKGDLFSELAWGRLMRDRPVKLADWLANHQPMARKLYLRKAAANPAEYQALAEEYGVQGVWDVREWKAIEGHNYRSIPK